MHRILLVTFTIATLGQSVSATKCDDLKNYLAEKTDKINQLKTDLPHKDTGSKFSLKIYAIAVKGAIDAKNEEACGTWHKHIEDVLNKKGSEAGEDHQAPSGKI